MDNLEYEMKKDIDQSHENVTGTNHKKKTNKKLILLIISIVVVVALGNILVQMGMTRQIHRKSHLILRK